MLRWITFPNAEWARPIELWRFADRAGTVAALPLLMARVETAARDRGAKTMWLGVWERNDRARAFYVKCFVDAGNTYFCSAPIQTIG
jgi:GNAT superfamily N-acetyltransferase